MTGFRQPHSLHWTLPDSRAEEQEGSPLFSPLIDRSAFDEGFDLFLNRRCVFPLSVPVKNQSTAIFPSRPPPRHRFIRTPPPWRTHPAGPIGNCSFVTSSSGEKPLNRFPAFPFSSSIFLDGGFLLPIIRSRNERTRASSACSTRQLASPVSRPRLGNLDFNLPFESPFSPRQPPLTLLLLQPPPDISPSFPSPLLRVYALSRLLQVAPLRAFLFRSFAFTLELISHYYDRSFSVLKGSHLLPLKRFLDHPSIRLVISGLKMWWNSTSFRSCSFRFPTVLRGAWHALFRRRRCPPPAWPVFFFQRAFAALFVFFSEPCV